MSFTERKAEKITLNLKIHSWTGPAPDEFTCFIKASFIIWIFSLKDLLVNVLKKVFKVSLQCDTSTSQMLDKVVNKEMCICENDKSQFASLFGTASLVSTHICLCV